MRILGAYIDPSGPVTTGKQFYNTWMVINSGKQRQCIIIISMSGHS